MANEQTLKQLHTELVGKFDTFVRSLLANNQDIINRMEELKKTPMVIVCLAIKCKIKPHFRSNKISAESVQELFKIDITSLKKDELDKMNKFIAAFIELADEALGE